MNIVNKSPFKGITSITIDKTLLNTYKFLCVEFNSMKRINKWDMPTASLSERIINFVKMDCLFLYSVLRQEGFSGQVDGYMREALESLEKSLREERINVDDYVNENLKKFSQSKEGYNKNNIKKTEGEM